MNNLAKENKVIAFPGESVPTRQEQGGGVEDVKADTKDGFTRLANDLFERLCGVEISGRQYRVFLAVIRKTYGFNKKTDWMVAEQISEVMGYSGGITHIRADLRELKNRKLIIQDGRQIGPNPTLSEWILLKPNRPKTVSPKQTENGLLKTDRNQSPRRPKTVSSADQNRSPQKTKDTIQKTILIKEKIKKENSSLPPVDFSVIDQITPEQISELKRIRKTNKGGTISQRVANQLAKEFQQAQRFGYSLDDCLTEWETRSWKSFKAEWIAPKNHLSNPINPQQAGIHHANESANSRRPTFGDAIDIVNSIGRQESGSNSGQTFDGDFEAVANATSHEY